MSAGAGNNRFSMPGTKSAAPFHQHPAFYPQSHHSNQMIGHAHPYNYTYGAQRTTMHPSGALYGRLPQPTQPMTEAEFWLETVPVHDSQGEAVTAPRAALYRDHPAMRDDLTMELNYYRNNGFFTQGHSHPQPLAPRLAHSNQEVNSGTRMQVQSLRGGASSSQSTTPSPMKTTPSPMKSNTEQPKRRTTAEKTNAVPVVINVAAYSADPNLDTAEKCRHYLEQPGGSTIQLTIEGDDWQDIKANHVQTYVARMYNGLTAPYAQTLPEGAKLSDEKMEKYHKQQQKATGKIADLLQTPTQIKTASARCFLLVEAAVSVHENGVPEDLYNKYQSFVAKDRQPDRNSRLDVESILSVRLAKIATIITNNKLIARDVLEGKNFEAIARDPDNYGQMKLTYLSSNLTRQARTDEESSKKRKKQAAEQEEEMWDSDEDAEGETDDKELAMKRMKRSGSDEWTPK